MAKVIERYMWRNPKASFEVSPFSAHPGAGWTLESDGFTIQWDDGTVGLPSSYRRSDAHTFEACERIMKECVARGFKGFQQ